MLSVPMMGRENKNEKRKEPREGWIAVALGSGKGKSIISLRYSEKRKVF